MTEVIVLLSLMARFLPTTVLAKLFPSWPTAQLLILQSFIRSPNAVRSSLCMAHDEMKSIRELDVQLIREKTHHLWMYFAERDDWVGENREHIVEAFSDNEVHIKIVHGDRDIPHAFCISMWNARLCQSLLIIILSDHGEKLAAQCFDWMHHLFIS
jgi:hypothetical protein